MMRMAGAEVNNKTSGTHECGGCGKKINDRYLLKAIDLYWHEDCLKCGCCDCRLGEVGSTLYIKGHLILCKRDYLRLFGTTGHCAACNRVIPAFEMVMRAKTNVYHLECFACQQCQHRFCVGDKFYLCDNKILCEYDYEERMVFANMPFSSDSLAHIKRQVSDLQQPPDVSGLANRSQGLPPQPMNCPAQPFPPPNATFQGGRLPMENQRMMQPCAGVSPGNSVHGGGSTSATTDDAAVKPSVNPGNGTVHTGPLTDDASSGYGSPDSLTLEDR